MANRSYRWLLISLAVFGFFVDQGTKYGVFRWLYRNGDFHTQSGNSYEVVPNWFWIIAQFDPEAIPCGCDFSALQTWSAPMLPRVNHGALFGMGGSHKGLANGVFSGICLLAAVAILVWGMRRGPSRERWLSAALGLILGGTVGNLYDRIVFGGVRDFLYYNHYFEWPVFNAADCCLVCGAGLLLIQAILVPPAKSEEQVSLS